jgi:hypothetical protein
MAVEKLTKEAATEELVNGVCGKAVNEPGIDSAILDRIMKKGEQGDASGDPEFLAWLNGLHVGSTSVARRWVERHPASALTYWAGAETVKQYLENQDDAPPAA